MAISEAMAETSEATEARTAVITEASEASEAMADPHRKLLVVASVVQVTKATEETVAISVVEEVWDLLQEEMVVLLPLTATCLTRIPGNVCVVLTVSYSTPLATAHLSRHSAKATIWKTVNA